MMIKPGISELSKRVDSRYTLVTMAAKRARMIGEERINNGDTVEEEKPVSIAAEEIMSGKVGYVRSDAIKRAQEWEDEKVAAILSLSNSEENEKTEETEETEEIEAIEENAENTEMADAENEYREDAE